MGSSPSLRSAASPDVYGYGAAYVVSAAIQALALPFVVLARREHAISDPIARDGDPAQSASEVSGIPGTPGAEGDPLP